MVTRDRADQISYIFRTAGHAVMEELPRCYAYTSHAQYTSCITHIGTKSAVNVNFRL